MKIRKKNINFRFKKSKLKSKTEKSIMQRSLVVLRRYKILFKKIARKLRAISNFIKTDYIFFI